MNNFMDKAGGSSFSLKTSDMSSYYFVESPIYSIPEIFLDIVNSDFYYPSSIQPGVYTPKTPAGTPDAVYLLYSNESMNEYDSNSTDYYNITTVANGAS
jgi:hypothetical protein